MHLYRLCRQAQTALDGRGAFLYGGRWNSPGTVVVYAAESRALALLEYLVHIARSDAPPDLMLLTIACPDSAVIADIDRAALPSNWRHHSGSSPVAVVGDSWIRARSGPLLRVPSALIPEESNFLINPRHPAAARIRIVASRDAALGGRLVGG